MRQPFFAAAIVLVLTAAVSGQTELPSDALTTLREMVTAELDGVAAAPVGSPTGKHVLAYGGSALTHDFEFVYELFPELGIFRILPTKKSGDWLYMSCGKVVANEAVTIDEDGTCSLNESLRDRILSCASGVLHRDVTAAKLACRQLPKHYLYSQDFGTFVSGIFAVQILLDSQQEPIAINSSNFWKDPPELKEQELQEGTKRLTRRSRPGRGSARPVSLPPVGLSGHRALWGAAACAMTLAPETPTSGDARPVDRRMILLTFLVMKLRFLRVDQRNQEGNSNPFRG